MHMQDQNWALVMPTDALVFNSLTLGDLNEILDNQFPS